MKKLKFYIFFITIIIFSVSCKSSFTDYKTSVTDDEIYDFINFVISDLNIPDSVDIKTKPEVLFRYKNSDGGYNIADFTYMRLKTDSTKNSDTVFIGVKVNRKTVLKPKDTSFILNQNKRLIENFEFDLSKFDRLQNDNPINVYFSLPYFTEDRSSVIISVSRINSSVFLGGSSEIIYYKKSENGWERKYIRRALH